MISLLQKIPFIRSRWALCCACPRQTAENFRRHLQRQLVKPAIETLQSEAEQ